MKKSATIILSIAMAATLSAAENRACNPGFEEQTRDWVLRSATKNVDAKTTMSRVETEPHSGQFCLLINDSWSHANPYVAQLIDWPSANGLPVLKFYVRANEPQQFRAGFLFAGHDANGNEKHLGTSPWRFDAESQWQQITYQPKNIPAGTDSIRICFWPTAHGDNAETGLIYIDDVEVYPSKSEK